MPPASARSRTKPAAVVPHVKVWLEVGGRYAFGPGMAEILRAVDRAGSIKQAAVDVGQSYRHVWGRIHEAEAALGRPLVEARVGGAGSRRSRLTDEARRLVTAFLALRARMHEVVGEEFARHFP